MPEGRGKKAKKARWQVVLGLKQVLCGALGLAWMMVIIFVLGVLAGRGDIYRWLSSFGLVAPAAKMAQYSPPGETPAAAPPAASSPAASKTTPPATPSPATTPSSPAPEPIKGSIAPAPSTPATAAKKAKKGAGFRDQKAKEDELNQLRQEVSSKLKFQNSFDTTPTKPSRATKQKDKHLAAAAAPKATPKLVRVGQYRDAKTAKAKMAELQKKGEKVTLKQGKDQKGVFYEILRENPATGGGADRVAQKSPPAGSSKPKKP
ncbi:MAG: hypothetical protein ACYDIC_10310 [Desulfobaccales bacterium]